MPRALNYASSRWLDGIIEAIPRSQSDAAKKQILMKQPKSSERVALEIDTIFVKMAHDLAEPIQALIADADVLRYQASIAKSMKSNKKLLERLDEISNRASNILETSLALYQQVQKCLDANLNVASVRVTKGQVHLYRVLNSLVDMWEERAASQGVNIKPLFDSLRGTYVQCDERKLKSTLGYLIGNAINYSFWGHRRTQDGSDKFARYVNIVGGIDQENAIVEFQNYGVGILKTKLSAVKQKFYGEELIVKKGRAGTGRGLWAASTFFKRIGGGIEVNSVYKGSDSLTEEGPYLTTVKVFMPYITPEED